MGQHLTSPSFPKKKLKKSFNSEIDIVCQKRMVSSGPKDFLACNSVLRLKQIFNVKTLESVPSLLTYNYNIFLLLERLRRSSPPPKKVSKKILGQIRKLRAVLSSSWRGLSLIIALEAERERERERERETPVAVTGDGLSPKSRQLCCNQNRTD